MSAIQVKNSIALIIGVAAAIAFVAATAVLLSSDPYVQFWAILLLPLSWIGSVITLFVWVWGLPLKKGAAIVLGGALCTAALVWTTLRVTNLVEERLRESRNEKAWAQSLREYANARAYAFSDVEIDPQQKKLMRPSGTTKGGVPPIAYVLPISESQVLIVQGGNAFAFDGTRFESVTYTGKRLDDSSWSEGSYVFEGKTYTHPAIPFNEIVAGVTTDSDPRFKRPALIDRVAPEPER